MTELSIVIPAYNEENRIKTTLEDILTEFEGQEIIVVSDGSTDGTADIVRTFPEVTLIMSQKTGGKGSAIVKGLRQAKGDVVGFLDADGSFKPAHVKALLSHMGPGVDCVIASKWIGRSFAEVEESTVRKVSGRVWNLMVRTLLGIRITDTQAGAKFMKNDAFRKIDGSFVSTGFEFDIELLYRLIRAGYKVKEVYVPFTDVRDSTFRYSKTPNMFLSLARIWLVLRVFSRRS